MNKIPVLYVREDSIYKTLPNIDAYDIKRDASTYTGTSAIIAHPPCRGWGQLSHMASPRVGEKELTLKAIAMVRANGGIVEHPSRTKAFSVAGCYNLPNSKVDAHKGFILSIDQWDFGHVARKGTWLYICGIEEKDLPALPPTRTIGRAKSITGQVKGTSRCTQYEREYTPMPLIEWMVEVITIIERNKYEQPNP